MTYATKINLKAFSISKNYYTPSLSLVPENFFRCKDTLRRWLAVLLLLRLLLLLC